jgi:Single-strand binding protein family
MIDGLVTGKLHGKPVERTGQNGRPYVIAKVLAPNGEGEAHIVNVITFIDAVGDSLLKLDDGDVLSLTGSLVPKVWTDREGVARASLDMVAQKLLNVQLR